MHKINYYKYKFKHLSDQGSDDWLEGRKYSFGGSEISTVFGSNKHDNFDQLIKRKITREYEKADTTEWGHLFEVVAKKLVKEKYGEIYNFGAMPHPQYPICYSPDGIVLTEDKTDILLLEIKCPIYRGIREKDGSAQILDNYYQQIQCGMNVFNVKGCVFAQFRFRRCRMDTFPGSILYDYAYHKEWKRKCTNKPIMFGYLHWNLDCELVDLGKVERICDYLKKDMKFEIHLNEKKKFERGLVLMFKLFDEAYTIVEPDKNFLKDKEDFLWDKFKLLDKSVHEKIEICTEIIKNEDVQPRNNIDTV